MLTELKVTKEMESMLERLAKKGRVYERNLKGDDKTVLEQLYMHGIVLPTYVVSFFGKELGNHYKLTEDGQKYIKQNLR